VGAPLGDCRLEPLATAYAASPTPTLPREERERERSCASVDIIRTSEMLGYDHYFVARICVEAMPSGQEPLGSRSGRDIQLTIGIAGNTQPVPATT